MKGKLITLGIAIVASLLLFIIPNSAGTNTTTADIIAPRPIPELEAERRAADTGITRDDCGRLTEEELARDRTPVTTISSNFVLEGVTAQSVQLPIAGTQARVAVFSATDRQLDVAIIDPDGAEVPTSALSHSDLVETSAASRMQDERAAADEGVLVINNQDLTRAGIYTLDVRRASSPVDIIVNDVGGPELVLSLDEPSYDASRPVVIRAKLVDGDRAISGARLVARVRGGQGRTWRFDETEPGVYTAAIRPGTLRGMVTFQVGAKGTTEGGLAFRRDGSIGTITDDAHATVERARRRTGTDEDLTVDVAVEVAAAGRYYVRANLLGPGGEPVAWAQDARELQPGRQTLTLRFARSLVAPYGQGLVLSDLTLLNVTNAPGVKAPSRVPSRIGL